MSPRLSFAILLVGLAFTACSNEPDERPNVILISIDTLRADHLGCYGYARETSPRLDAFAREAVLYEQAYAPARTGAFVDSTDGGYVGGRRGFARGFDSYQHAPLPGSRFAHDMAATVNAGVNWLAQGDPKAPFFLFLHTKSVHSTREPGVVPYYKPDPYQQRFLQGQPLRYWSGVNGQPGSQQLTELNLKLAGDNGAAAPSRESVKELIALYDAGIAYVDEQFGRLLDALAGLDLRGNTIIVVVSDHGETFLEHRFLGHLEVYDAALQVPLILHDPRSPRGLRVRDQAQLVDLFPTLLDRSGLEAPPGSGGLALLDRERSVDTTRLDFSYFKPEKDPAYRAYGVRQGDWKLIWHKRKIETAYETLLFNTLDDPGELRPVLGQSERRHRMLSRLRQWLAESTCKSSSQIDLLEEELKELAAQGYIASPDDDEDDADEVGGE